MESLPLRAAWVFPVAGEPLRNGVVEHRHGRITAVREYHRDEQVHDLGDVALLPALVNAHAHCEFSFLGEPIGCANDSFPEWLAQVIELRRNGPQGDELLARRDQAVRAGLTEALAGGTIALGDIAAAPCADVAYRDVSPESTVFLELLGLAPERWDNLRHDVRAFFADEAPGYRRGLSPHASYTIARDFLAELCEFSREKQIPVAFHLAESLEEIELLRSGSGRLAEALKSFGAIPAGAIPRGTRPLDYLACLAEAQRAIVVHGNFLSSEEIAFLGERSDRMSAAYCPRTHAKFCAGRYPLVEMLSHNVNVCLGTDSRGTNPDLNLWREMRFVAERFPEVSGEGVLSLGTIAGAEALGIAHDFGTLVPEKRSVFAALPLSELKADDPHELLFSGELEPRLFAAENKPPIGS